MTCEGTLGLSNEDVVKCVILKRGKSDGNGRQDIFSVLRTVPRKERLRSRKSLVPTMFRCRQERQKGQEPLACGPEAYAHHFFTNKTRHSHHAETGSSVCFGTLAEKSKDENVPLPRREASRLQGLNTLTGTTTVQGERHQEQARMGISGLQGNNQTRSRVLPSDIRGKHCGGKGGV